MSYIAYLVQILDPSGLLPVGVYGDEDGEAVYETLMWESESVPKPTKEEFDVAVAKAKALMYQTERRGMYPSVAEQLDTLFHEGYDGWRAQIQAVKDQFPKPEGV